MGVINLDQEVLMYNGKPYEVNKVVPTIKDLAIECLSNAQIEDQKTKILVGDILVKIYNNQVLNHEETNIVKSAIIATYPTTITNFINQELSL